MDDWYKYQQEAVNIGETLPPMSFQVVLPPAHAPERAYLQVAHSAMKNPPVHSHVFLRDARNVMNVNPTSYRVRGDTSRAPQRSEVGESHQRLRDEVRRSRERVSSGYS